MPRKISKHLKKKSLRDKESECLDTHCLDELHIYHILNSQEFQSYWCA